MAGSGNSQAVIARAALVGGAIAATLDLVYACIRQAGRGRSPVWTLQSVASGWLGEQAFAGGWPAALLGTASHYLILLVAALLFMLVSRRFIELRRHVFLVGAAFGVAVFLCMNFVVLPASAFPFHPKYTAAAVLEGFVSHALLVGIPIALTARWLLHKQ